MSTTVINAIRNGCRSDDVTDAVHGPRTFAVPIPETAQIRAAAEIRSLRLHELNENAPIDHDLVAGLEALGDVVSIAGSIAQGYVLAREAAVGLREIDEGKILVMLVTSPTRDQ